MNQYYRRPGDAVVYDELVHASTHDGLKLTNAAHKLSFKHNDPDDLREVLQSVKDLDHGFATGTRSILICVESIYSSQFLPFYHSYLQQSQILWLKLTSNAIWSNAMVFSVNGDICPLKECVQVAKEIFPLGNAQSVIDEAHSTGVLGPYGRGLVSMLGLEKEIAIRIHMCSKAIASTGGKPRRPTQK